MSIKMSLELVTPVKEIEQKILNAIRKHLSQKLSSLESKISNRIKPLIISALDNSPETQSILSGELQTELGITEPSSQLQSIFNAIAESTEVTFQKPSIKGGKEVSMVLTVSAVPFDLGAITSGMGTYRTEKGQDIPWFTWLTTLGDAVIVREHESTAGFPDKSRTGGKIMISGKGWRVPPQFAGTAENNFVTRAVDSILPQIEDVIVKTIGGSI
jgi:hypothetical protein